MQTTGSGRDQVSGLLEILELMHDRTDALLQTLDQERQALKALRLDELTALHPATLQLLQELHALEERRTALTARLARQWGVSADSLTLREIAARMGGELAGHIDRLRRRLDGRITAARDRNRGLGVLVSRSLEFFHEALTIPYGNASAPALYSQSGRAQSRRPDGALIQRKG